MDPKISIRKISTSVVVNLKLEIVVIIKENKSNKIFHLKK